MEQERQFRGIWIPAEVWLDDELSAVDMIVLAEVNSLDGPDGCFASNEYLARFCHCSEKTISRSLDKLIEMGYIEVAAFNGRVRTLKVCPGCLDNLSRQNRQNVYADETKCPGSNNDNKKERKKNNKSDDVVSIYHEECPSLPKVKELNDKRKTAVKRLLEKYDLDQIRECFRKAEKSSFLTGGGSRAWRADFDFLIRMDKFNKILEGGYDDFGKEEPERSPETERTEKPSFDVNEMFQAATQRRFRRE